MSISLAQAITGACSLGAVYNAGKAIAGSNGKNLLREEELFALPPSTEFVVEDEVSSAPKDIDTAPISVDENEDISSEDSMNDTESTQTIEVISKMDLEEYITAVIEANTPKSSTRMNSILAAASLGVIAYLVIKNDSLNSFNEKVSSDLSSCIVKSNYSTSLHMLPIGVLKPVSSSFFGRVTNAFINFYAHSHNNPEAKKLYADPQQPECRFIQYKKGDLNLGVQKRCLDLTLGQGSPSLASLTLIHIPVLETLKPFNGTSPLYDQIAVTCQEKLLRNLTHVQVSIECNGQFKSFLGNSYKFVPMAAINYKTKETIYAESKLIDGIPSQIGNYSSYESSGKTQVKTREQFTTSDELKNMPLGIKDAFPLLHTFVQTGSAQVLESLSK